MRAWKQKLKRTATEWLALPPDTLMDVSRVSCTDGETVIVENVVSLLRVDDTKVHMDLGKVKLEIVGANFEVTLITQSEVHLHGRVDAIYYRERGGAK